MLSFFVCPSCGTFTAGVWYPLHVLWRHVVPEIRRQLRDDTVPRLFRPRDFLRAGAPGYCPVCMEESSCDTVELTGCGHRFCTSCIRMWFNAHTTCPVCMLDYATSRSNS